MKTFLLVLLLPCAVQAQEVSPVISKDYLALIRKDTARGQGVTDSTNSFRRSALHLINPNYDYYQIGSLTVKNNAIVARSSTSKSLHIGGHFSSGVEVKKANHTPELQTTYVQGRPQNNVAVWQGPETNEMFSYGPAINRLVYDGSTYDFDVNGRLVSANAGGEKPATVYKPDLLRTGFAHNQSIQLQSGLFSNNLQVASVRLRVGQKTEQLLLPSNKNNSRNLNVTAEALLNKWLTVSGAYSYYTDRFSTADRNGFLHRVYQNSLLTPVSFSNRQGAILATGQRSYSKQADNPLFLLENNPNAATFSHQISSFVIEKKQGSFRFRITPSLEDISQKVTEGYAAATAYFPSGKIINRTKKDRNALLQVNAWYDVNHNESAFKSRISVHTILSQNESTIAYQPGEFYNYQRSATNASLSWATNYHGWYTQAGLTLTNQSYASNTVDANTFFQPAASAYLRLEEPLNLENITVKWVGTLTRFATEIPVSTSFAQSNLVSYNTANAFTYFPVTEAVSFRGLKAIGHTEWTTRLELSYRNRFGLTAEVFSRSVTDDVFAVPVNGLLVLKNLAAHCNYGIEIEGTATTYSRTVQTAHAISFFKNRDKVTGVLPGYNYTPVAGFANVNKALVEGQALGAIVGSRFVKDANNNTVIGADGFPLADALPAVIGNPVPDFTMKATNSITWKKFSLNLYMEWRKGGDVWNGTQAVLDYYGRSKTSGDQRTTTGYVFDGVTTDGKRNTTPVSFYDPSQPFDRSRWVRYGHSGVAEAYIQKGDVIRINNIALSYSLNGGKYFRNIAFTAYAGNLILWSAYKGADPSQLLYDAGGTQGLDFFNLPSTKNFGCNITLQF